MFTHRFRSAYFVETIIRFPKMLFSIEVISSLSSPKKIISKSRRFIDIFYTFRDCNVYNFMLFFFFTNRSSVTLYIIFYYVYHVLFCLILQETSSTVVQTYVSQSHWSIQLTVVLSGSQILSNSLLFRSKSKNEFILKICKVGHLKRKRLSCGKWNYFAQQVFFHPTCVQPENCLVESEIILLNRSFFTQLVFNSRLWMENHW